MPDRQKRYAGATAHGLGPENRPEAVAVNRAFGHLGEKGQPEMVDAPCADHVGSASKPAAKPRCDSVVHRLGNRSSTTAARRTPRIRVFKLRCQSKNSASMGLVVVALMLTFSRGAFLGFIVINALFLLWHRNLKTLILGVLLAAVVLLLLPEAVYDRVTTGFGRGFGSG